MRIKVYAINYFFKKFIIHNNIKPSLVNRIIFIFNNNI